jgi:hypothetical protein
MRLISPNRSLTQTTEDGGAMRREDIAIEVVDLKGGQPMNSKPDISAVQAEPISKSLEEESATACAVTGSPIASPV